VPLARLTISVRGAKNEIIRYHVFLGKDTSPRVVSPIFLGKVKKTLEKPIDSSSA